MNLKFHRRFESNILKTLLIISYIILPPSQGHAGEALVQFKPGVSVTNSLKRDQHPGIRYQIRRRFTHIFNSASGEVVLIWDNDLNSQELLRLLKNDPNVEQVSLNYRRKIMRIPNDPAYGKQWFMEKIKAPYAWDITTGSKNTVVMVVDSGINPVHEDIVNNLWENPNDSENGYDDDKNGYIDDVHGIDAISKTGMVFDGEGHGTHVAGIIGATGNNGKGITGVNWKVSLVSCRFIDATGYGSDSDAITCMDYAVALKERGINIAAINASWGGYQDNPLLKAAIRNVTSKGIAVNSGNNGFSHILYGVHKSVTKLGILSGFFPCHVNHF
jgi:subtilisin family serine protease